MTSWKDKRLELRGGYILKKQTEVLIKSDIIVTMVTAMD